MDATALIREVNREISFVYPGIGISHPFLPTDNPNLGINYEMRLRRPKSKTSKDQRQTETRFGGIIIVSPYDQITLLFVETLLPRASSTSAHP